MSNTDTSTSIHPLIAAFLLCVRKGEGTLGANGYRTMFGGRLFDSFSDHPRVAVHTRFGWTSAAGAYQFMARSPIPGTRPQAFTRVDTWDELKRRLSLPDFSPNSQDIAAIELLRECGAYAPALAGDFSAAFPHAGKEWASMPGSPYGQPQLTAADMLAFARKLPGAENVK